MAAANIILFDVLETLMQEFQCIPANVDTTNICLEGYRNILSHGAADVDLHWKPRY